MRRLCIWSLHWNQWWVYRCVFICVCVLLTCQQQPLSDLVANSNQMELWLGTNSRMCFSENVHVREVICSVIADLFYFFFFSDKRWQRLEKCMACSLWKNPVMTFCSPTLGWTKKWDKKGRKGTEPEKIKTRMMEEMIPKGEYKKHKLKNRRSTKMQYCFFVFFVFLTH